MKPAEDGPDGRASWAIVACCCFIHTLLYGMTRLNGVLLVESRSRFNVSREAASFPYTFANFVRNTSGPLVGFLGQKFGVRTVTTFGGLLAAIGIGTCFLAEGPETITILWGVVYGLGLGLGSILIPVKINQYFDKHRATAIGISYSGSCLGSFILPSIVEMLIDTYGLSGTFLILSGMVLHCVPAALLLRNPNFVIESSKQHIHQNFENERQSIISGKEVRLYTVKSQSDLKIKAASDPLRRKFGNTSKNNPMVPNQIFKCLSCSYLSYQINTSDLPKGEQMLNNDSKEKWQGNRTESEGKCVINNKLNQNSESSNYYNSSVKINPFIWKTESGYSLPFSCSNISSTKLVQDDKRLNQFKNLGYFNSQYINSESDIAENQCKNSDPATVQDPKNKSTIFSMIYDPVFILITVTNALYNFTFVCMISVIVDFARDIGVDATGDKFILMSLSVGDFIGRVGLGWVTDGGYMSKTGFTAFWFLSQGAMAIAIYWSTGFVSIVALAAFYGLSEGALIVLFPLLIAEFIDGGKQTVAIPSATFLAGPLCLTVAPLIGYFRDGKGSYEYIFYGIGAISALCSFAWLLTTCLVKFRRRTENIIIDSSL
ncbi:hypothetical protein JTE90_000720 [Oedothorax gibbosus]|uniref:Monocarboxylate transporter n=1 Tax=Oedothorax gibbosus TaxID=931172 RepID=A0AAV6UPN3_9ARAC|nr:hypothetical protein JTE90_000720 [Oedothorax gibbosus]